MYVCMYVCIAHYCEREEVGGGGLVGVEREGFEKR